MTTFYFETDLPKGNVLIDDFVRKAFDYYKELQSKKRDTSRYAGQQSGGHLLPYLTCHPMMAALARPFAG